jgi:type VI secretion system protein ImpE
MSPEQCLKDGDLDGALAALQQRVRSDPSHAPDRIFLFQLLAVLGDWSRAKTQLALAAELDASALMTANVYGAAIEAELRRAAVFRGERNPLVVGQPQEWIAWLFEANRLFMQGHIAAATELRAAAFEAAPANAGTLDGAAFEWLADADPRFGPCLELIMQNEYYWVPMDAIGKVSIQPPTQLRDLVWMPAVIEWGEGGQVTALIPSRYPGTETCNDSALRLTRATAWSEKQPDWAVGMGQRILTTDVSDTGLCDLRELVFFPAAA